MPTQNKTENLLLNQWLSTDKPKREDFVSDNLIIDQVISEHLEDFDLHLSESDRTLLSNPFAIGTISGDGQSSKIHTLDFIPKFIFVFLKTYPLSYYDSDNGYTVVNSGIATNGYGSSSGINLTLNSLTLSQSTTASDGIFNNLNAVANYSYIAFK